MTLIASFFICEILIQMELVILWRVYIFNLLLTDGVMEILCVSAFLRLLFDYRLVTDSSVFRPYCIK